MMTIQALIKEGTQVLERVTVTAALDTQWILCDLLDMQRGQLLIHGNRQVSEDQVLTFRAHLARRASGEPLQYVLGHQEFMGLLFHVSQDVLIPRQDTEVLVETILTRLKGNDQPKILDIGVGSGAISCSLAHFIDQAQVRGLDISDGALAMARRNAKSLGLEDRVTYNKGDLFSLEKTLVEGVDSYDVIVSNPPYIPSEDILTLQQGVKDHEPMLALDGGQDGYDCYKALVAQAHLYMKENGILAFETGHDQARTIGRMMEDSGHYDRIEIIKDLAGIERVVLGYKKA